MKQTTGFSFLLSDSPPAATAKPRREDSELGELELDLSDFGQGGPTPGLEVDPPRRQPTPPGEEALERSRPPAREPSALSQVPETPAIKKIQFPARRAVAHAPTKEERAATGDHAQTRGHAQTRDHAPTKVSERLSRQAPRVLDRETSPSPTESEELAGELEPPSDWHDLSASTDDAGSWSTDTPSAKEIWLQARRAWKTKSREALALGEQGLRQAGRVAVDWNRRVQVKREERRRLAEERSLLSVAQEGAHSERTPQDVAPEDIATPGPSSRGTTSPAAPPKKPAVPSPASRAILGLAKSAGRAMVAPASALTAAVVVYLGGTQLLGVDGGQTLSRATTSSSQVDLGALPQQKNRPAEPQADPERPRRESKDADSGAMQTEVAPLPDGLSWPGKGLIEVVTSEDELIYVDGVFTGRGPLRRIPVTPGEHEVKIKQGGNERSGTVQVEAEKNTRAVFTAE